MARVRVGARLGLGLGLGLVLLLLLQQLAAVVVAETTGEDAKGSSMVNATSLPPPLGVLDLLFDGRANVKTFFFNHFEQSVYHLAQRGDPETFLTRLAQLEALTDSIASLDDYAEWFDLWSAGTTVRAQGGADPQALDQIASDSGEAITSDTIQNLLADGNSFVVKTEATDRPYSILQRQLQALFTTMTNVHAYISPPNAQALAPHTDPYDVFVVQVYGQKEWTLCTPQPPGGQNLSDAHKAQWQEIAKHNIQGCTNYQEWQLAKMDCQHITLLPGDLLYIPKGVIHYATTGSVTGSTHLTVSIERLSHSWMMLFHRTCNVEHDHTLCEQLNELIENAATSRPEALIWFDLATAPLEEQPMASICQRLSYLVLGDHPASVLQLAQSATHKLNRYTRSATQIRAALPSIIDCDNLDKLHFASMRLASQLRQSRSSAWRPNCQLDGSCGSQNGCDCDGCDEGITCKVGYRVTNSVNGDCEQCSAGTYSPWGQYCYNCGPGSYSSAGQGGCTSCDAGKYQDSYGQSGCKNVGQGYYASGRARSNRQACSPGFYSNSEVATECKPCSASPFPGNYQDQYAQSACKACPSGKYAANDIATGCVESPGLQVVPTMQAKSLELAVDNSVLHRTAFRVTLGVWKTTEFAYTVASNYPQEFDADEGGEADTSLITLRHLLPGTFYYIKVEGKNEAGNYPDVFEYQLARTTCGCLESDTSGTPGNLTINQYLGRIYFNFIDHSFCEDGFLLYRDGYSFTSAYDVVSSQACERVYSPKTVYDDILNSDDLNVGNVHQYCVSAYSRTAFVWAEDESVSGSYESHQTCTSFQIQWEARIQGRVQLTDSAGKLPVADTSVEWFFQDRPHLGGNLTTGPDGTFTIYVKTSELSNDVESIVVRVAKQSGDISHRYTCSGQPCSEQTLLVSALTFDNEVVFVDATTVPFEGYLFIQGTEHASYANGCPLQGVRVCVINHIEHTSLGCSVTSTAGYFVVPVAAGLTVYPSFDYNNHTFERLNEGRAPTGFYDSVDLAGAPVAYDFYKLESDGSRQAPVIYIDTTTTTMTVQVAGGLCNRTLGNTTLQLSYPTCAASWSQEITFGEYEHLVEVPAQNFDVELISLTHNAVELGDTVPNYFAAKGTRKQRADLLSSRPAAVRWEYHPEPVVTLSMTNNVGGDCNLFILPRDTTTTITVDVTESFWADITACPHIDGNVSIVNMLGETTERAATLVANKAMSKEDAALLSRCADGCLLPLEHELAKDGETVTRAYTSIDAMAGEPELVATIEGVQYAKLLSASISSLYTVEVRQAVIVTGDKIISDLFTMDFPEYFPLMILYDPPGGESFAYYLEVSKVSADIEGKKNRDDSVTFTTTISIQTSEDLGVPSSPVFVTPALTVKYTETKEVIFDMDACDVSIIDKVTWSLDDKSKNTNSFTIKLYGDIKDAEIPTLKNNLVLAEQDLVTAQAEGTSDEQQEAQKKVDKLKEAISGWTSVLNYTDAVLINATQGSLEAVTALMPETLMSAARDLDMKPDAAAESELELYSAISFTGGGQAYTFEETSGVDNSSDSGTMAQKDFHILGAVAAKVQLVGVGPSLDFEIGYTRHEESADITTTDTDVETTRGFVLADGDGGDKFVVKVARDPIFGSFVFTTVAGSSKCPHETNTYAREQPRIIVESEPLSAVYPGQAAVFKLRLINDANEANQYELYVRDVEGAEVFINGDTLAEGRLYEQMPAYSEYTETLYVRQADERTSVSFKLGFRSRCERELFLVLGNWPASSFQHDERELTVDFLAPCSTVAWAGDLLRTSTFVINSALTSPTYRVVVSNPEAPKRYWADNDRLESVLLQYRPFGASSWTTAQNASGQPAELKELESSFGYASVDWKVDGIADGEYELRVFSRCSVASLAAPDGINDFQSVSLLGTVDRSLPRVFAMYPRASTLADTGADVEVIFTEPLQCTRPFTFSVKASIGDSISVSERVLDVICQGHAIKLSIAKTFSASLLSGKTVEIEIANVYDKAGNKVRQPVSWVYQYREVADATPSAVELDGLKFAVTWNAAWADSSSTAFAEFAEQLQGELASLLQVSASRISVESLRESASDGMVLVALRIEVQGGSSRRRSMWTRRDDSNEDLSAEELANLLLTLLYAEDASPSLESGGVLESLNRDEPPSQSVAVSDTSAMTDPEASSGSATAGDDSFNAVEIVTLVLVLLAVVLLAVLVYHVVFSKHKSGASPRLSRRSTKVGDLGMRSDSNKTIVHQFTNVNVDDVPPSEMAAVAPGNKDSD
ncbi:uncharacterized protein MONBRDRAFT_12796 [Monosiga brevicollis MX1]|uniref:Ribosomal oxygenase 2 n=1 Tax=Monosiga brevicollis TaxID=81824 RepID=A9VDC2_MONBE|nr:uncharacterized protein MONBRDRAFT_12796 [Monosiga brevicollis MX1]EDQ84448.1 predicted protein [Monosiga brevicollis MX1]|eukprot:XP_001750743.1 hypothetical protein [Monosiga brevicollis MX1]